MRKATDISALCVRCSILRGVILLLLSLVVMCTLATSAIAKRLVPETERKKIIVLDPGHGGHDNGAQGPVGTFEKHIVLKFARAIAAELNAKYSVVYTRTDDYWIDIPNRTATANHLDADLFISLHTGGSFLHKAEGITIFYYKKSVEHALNLVNNTPEPTRSDTTGRAWKDIQIKHQGASKRLATSIYDRINGQTDFTTNTIQGAPLVILEGADMPAILLEAGCLTNPVEEKKLKNIDWLTDLAKKVSHGIDDFLLSNQQ